MTTEELPKEALLLKLLNMTTSDNDNIALMSARKANDLLASAGWSWEKLLSGKIKVVADPFGPRVSKDDPLERMASNPSPPPRAPQPPRKPPNPTPRPAYGAPGAAPSGSQAGAKTGRFSSSPPFQRTTAQQAFTARSALGVKHQISNRVNNYANHCYLCGDSVNSQEGFIFRAIDINPTAKNGWETLCDQCNKKIDETIPSKRALKWANVNQPSTANL